MSTIETRMRKRGNAYFIRFYNGGRRFKICLPVGMTRAAVGELSRIVDALVDVQKYGGETPRGVALYLEAAPPIILEKLAAVALITIQRPKTLREALDEYVARVDVTTKKGTRSARRHALSLLGAYFGEDTPAASISNEEARAFALSLVDRFARSTIKTALVFIKAFFASLVASNELQVNPFKDVPLNLGTPTARSFTVPKEFAERILDACPSAADRALFALYRFGGLRAAEALAVKWSLIDWEHRRLTVPSSKTERYEGKALRVLPLFPELERALSDYWETLPEGAPDVLFNLSSWQAYRKVAGLVSAAGLEPWPKLIQNLRASRENELIAAGYPEHIVAAWLGHSTRTQARYYLRVLDEYFDRATGAKCGAKNGAIEKNTLEK